MRSIWHGLLKTVGIIKSPWKGGCASQNFWYNTNMKNNMMYKVEWFEHLRWWSKVYFTKEAALDHIDVLAKRGITMCVDLVEF